MISEEIKDPLSGIEANVYKDRILIGTFSTLQLYFSGTSVNDTIIVLLEKGIMEKVYYDKINNELIYDVQSLITLHLPHNPLISPLKCIIKNIDKHHVKLPRRVVINKLEAELVIEL